jgi:hypothetical protein
MKRATVHLVDRSVAEAWLRCGVKPPGDGFREVRRRRVNWELLGAWVATAAIGVVVWYVALLEFTRGLEWLFVAISEGRVTW